MRQGVHLDAAEGIQVEKESSPHKGSEGGLESRQVQNNYGSNTDGPGHGPDGGMMEREDSTLSLRCLALDHSFIHSHEPIGKKKRKTSFLHLKCL